MKKLYHRLLAFAAATPLAMTGIASASIDGAAPSAERAWAQAVSLDTLEGYTSFAIDYPDSSFASEARKRLLMTSVSSGAAMTMARDLDVDSSSGADGTSGFIPDSIMIV